MKALITTLLVLGSSTAALAQPVQATPYNQYEPGSRYDNRYDGRFDDRYDGDHNERFDRRGWFRRPVLLAQNVSLVRQWNHQQRPMLIDIDQRIAGLKKLRIDRQDGRMFLDTVVINFADGHQQTVRVNQVLSMRQPSVFIDLDHGNVTSMYVNGNAMRGRATFDVIGLRR